MNRFIAVLLLAAVAALVSSEEAQGNLWAVLVAGSNTWDNYRHQADVYHAYQILHKHGIPDERIIVMHYDDIANNEENPTPGKVINQPNGKDVYHGVPKDYTGEDVTPDNFLKVIQGDAEGLKGVGSGKVLKSGPNDHVFINFADHGGTGLIAFPNDDVVTVQQLNDALNNMFKKKMYKKLLFYMEACESGSMFDGVLSDKINVFATTAANAEEPSYGCYCDVPGWDTCLGDLYSVNWMQDSDKEDIEKESIQEQYVIVKSETDESHVSEYGDKSIAKLVVGQFQGRKEATSGILEEPKIRVPRGPHARMATYDIPILQLKRKMQRTNSIVELKKLQTKMNITLARRALAEGVITRIAQEATSNNYLQTRRVLTNRVPRVADIQCHHNVMKHFSRNCFNLAKHQHVLQYVFILNNLCEEHIPQKEILETISKVCKQELL